MSVQVTSTYRFGEFSLDPDKRLLDRAGEERHLASRPFQVLVHLMENRDRLVTRRELLDRFWQGEEVYDHTLSKCIGAIRKALDDKQESPRFIETRYAEGYRYVGPLQQQIRPAEPKAAASDHQIGSECLLMETARELKIVVEEEICDSALTAGDVTLTTAGNRRWSFAGRTLPRGAIFALLAISAVTLAAVSALVIGRGDASSREIPPALAGSIAVMPLRNLTGDPANEYLSDGFTETLINTLSKTDGLRVISRTSSFTFKNQEIDPHEVGRRLNVATLLEGSVLKSGEQLRIEVRLVNAGDGHIIWARDSYDRSFDDVFALQDEIALGVTSALRLALDPRAEQKLARRYTDNTEAYKTYLMGRYYWNKRTAEGLRKAIECFEGAIRKDPSYALAYAGLADCYRLGVWFIPLESKEAIARTKAAAERAVELDPSLAETHRALAGAHAMDWNWTGCERELTRALDLNPGSAEALHDYSLYLNYMKRPDESIARIKRAQELDPLSLVINADLGMAFYFARRYDEAIAAYQKVLEMDGNFAMARFGLGQAYLRKGLRTAAIEELQRSVALEEHATIYLTGLGEAYSDAGKSPEARQILGRLNELAKERYVPPFEIATLHSVLGESDAAFTWMEKAYEEKSAYVVDLSVDPAFDPLRTDPRFLKLLQRIGLPG